MRLRQRTNTITHQNSFHITGKQIRTPLNTRITIKTQDTRFARLQSIVIFQIGAHFLTVERSIYIIFIIIERQSKFHHWYQQKVAAANITICLMSNLLNKIYPPYKHMGRSIYSNLISASIPAMKQKVKMKTKRFKVILF